MDGLFEILIIGLILLAPVLEGLLKKRRGRTGRGPGRDRPGGAPGGAGPGQAPEAPGSGEGDARASEEVLSEELWQELTGGPPPWKADEEPRSSRASAPGLESPVDDGHGLEAEGEPEADAWRGEEDDGIRVSAPPGEIGTGEIGPGDAVAADADTLRREALRQELAAGGGALRRSGARAGRTRIPGSGVEGSGGAGHPLLGEIDGAALRRAVIWREILGKPRALRGRQR